MSRTLGSVDSSQVWVDAFFFAMERKSRSTNAEGAGEAADFADAVVARFNNCMAAQSQLPTDKISSELNEASKLDDASARKLAKGLIQKDLSGDRGIRVGDFEDHPRSPGPGTLDPD